MAAMLPVVARLWTTSPTQFQAASQKTLDLLLVATIPLVVVLLTLADPIVDLLFGAGQFGPSFLILRIKALTLAFLFVDYYLATILIAVGRERRWLLLAVAACFVSPALNWVLIPLTHARYGNGGVGAAVATVAAGFTRVGLLSRYAKRYVGVAVRPYISTRQPTVEGA